MRGMEITECFLQGKRPNQEFCEDGYVLTPHFAAVIDGSTSKVAGRNGGREAMLTVTEAIKTLPADADKEEMLSHLTRALAEKNIPQAKNEAQYRLTCSAVIFSRARRCVWLVGDCQCRWGGRTFTNGKEVDRILTQARGDILRYLLAHGHTVEELRADDLGRKFIFSALREQTNFQNDPSPFNPFRYPVLDGTPVAPALVPEISPPIYIKECVLASDGYPQLCDTLSETERSLKKILSEDPLCISANAGTKAWLPGNLSFDDRCYLRFSI